MNTKTYDVIIIGAGFAGIGAAIKLKLNGFSDFILLEKSSEIGGVWRDNTYPGCACDVPSYVYSYSFEPKNDWSNICAPQKQIFNYLKHCVKKYGIEKHIITNSNIITTKFNKSKSSWKISDNNGQNYYATLMVSSTGGINEPLIPDIKGINNFKGTIFHSAKWNHSFNLSNKKIAVVGTGASSIQFVPEIAKKVLKLTLFQRTPAWILPRHNTEILESSQKRFKRFPLYLKFWREYIYWILEIVGLFRYPNSIIAKIINKRVVNYLKSSITNLELRKRLKPNYQVGCKRILYSNEFYPTLNLSHVVLNTTGIKEIVENGVIDKKNNKIECDGIILGTGFKIISFNHYFECIGLDKRSLFKEFAVSGGEAYYGMTMNGFPNMIVMVGPNTGLGHNSIIHMMESQINYIISYLKNLKKYPKSYFNIKNNVQELFNKKLQNRLKKMVWSTGCNSYYLSHFNGKNTTLWPETSFSYRKKTKKMNISEYDIVKSN